MAKNKTTETTQDVSSYTATITDESRKNDFEKIVGLITEHTRETPKMWGTSIVGFGSYDYQYESGHSGSAPILGSASRANAITLYFGSEFENRDELLAQLGKHKTGKGCIYIKSLSDVNLEVFINMIQNAYQHRKNKNN